MAKKRQLNVRLSDTLLNQLEERVQTTKMGMAAMVEILLSQALQQQVVADPDFAQSDRFDGLEKRIEALEAKFANQSSDLVEVESSSSIKSAIESLPDLTSLETSSDEASANQANDSEALSIEDLANRLAVEVRTLSQKKDKGTFSDWAKKHDPESMGWKYVADEDRFYLLVG